MSKIAGYISAMSIPNIVNIMRSELIELRKSLLIKIDYIVTRNTKDFKNGPIPLITPSELFKICDGFI